MSPTHAVFREFAAEPLIQSSRTEYQNCRARQGLSIGINFIHLT